MSLLRGMIGQATLHTTRRPWRRLHETLPDPATAQNEVLEEILQAAKATRYGRRYGFGTIRDPRAYQEHVPIVTHDQLRSHLDATAEGTPDVLVPGRPRFMERTGGSTGPTKLLPYTDLLLDQLRRGIHAWVHDLYRTEPRLRSGRQYWSVSPVGARPEQTAGGIAIGVPDDTAYLGRASGWAFRQTLAVPPSVAKLSDVLVWRRSTLRHLVRADDLTLVSVWSPTFLQLLLAPLIQDPAASLADLPPRRRRAVRAALDAGEPPGVAYWPQLKVVSVWRDGPSAASAHRLQQLLPHARVQGKGLLATEGLVTIPLHDAAAPVVVPNAHFYEFLPLDAQPDARPCLLHELRRDRRYTILLTTGGGLYRYRLDDIVRCVGHHDQTPMLRFEGRLHHTSDLVGEKLHESHVRQVLTEMMPDADFAMLAPVLVPSPHYVLLVDADEGDPLALSRELDARLQANPQYAYARRLGQLAPVSIRSVPHAMVRFLELQGTRGALLGSVKIPALSTDPDLVDRLAHASAPEVLA